MLRRATPADAAACAAIVQGWLESTPWVETRLTMTQLIDGFKIGIPTYEVWVEEENKSLNGYLSYGPSDQLIRGFYTARPGAGTGKRLLNHIKKGKSYLQLWTHAPNTRAHAFYQREGFTFTDDCRAGEDGPNEWHMSWSATQNTPHHLTENTSRGPGGEALPRRIGSDPA